MIKRQLQQDIPQTTHSTKSVVAGLLRQLQAFFILISFLLIPVWYRFAEAPQPFTAHYITGFIFFVPVIIAILLWMLNISANIRMLLASPRFIWWQPGLLILLLWALASTQWAFMRNLEPGLAYGAAFQLAIVWLFCLVVASSCLTLETTALIFIGGMLLHGTIAAAQVIAQSSVGLHALGEFTLDPELAGTSVVQSGASRWLRPYGLASHPNILAGYIAVGILFTLPLIHTQSQRQRRIALLAFAFGLSILLLTFSRSAWLGLGFGGLIYLPHLLKQRRDLLILVLVSGLILSVFIAGFSGFLLPRLGAGDEAIEQRSLNDRAIYMEVATEAIQAEPFTGIGAGNFPWYASYYLFYNTNTDMRGDHVHNVYLTVTSELGIPGLLALLTIIILPVINTIRNVKNETKSRFSAVLVSVGVLLAIVGLFDHYPWTMVHYQLMWMGLLGLSRITTAGDAPQPD